MEDIKLIITRKCDFCGESVRTEETDPSIIYDLVQDMYPVDASKHFRFNKAIYCASHEVLSVRVHGTNERYFTVDGERQDL